MLLVAFLIIAAAVYLMVRRVEVRLVLFGAGLLMAVAAGKPLAVFDTFTRAMVAGMVAPICAAMGFAAVLAATGCDRELVHLLLAPIRRAPWLVVPGGILAAYLVNMAVPSQTSTAAAVGPILAPLMLATGIGAEVAGAALVLGASFGGDLLNPGAQDVQALAGVTGLSAPAISALVIPAGLAGALTAAIVFTLIHRRGNFGFWILDFGLGRGRGRGTGTCLNKDAQDVQDGEGGRVAGPGLTVEDRQAAPPPSTIDPQPSTLLPSPSCTSCTSSLITSPSPIQNPKSKIQNRMRALIPLVPVALLLLAYGGWGPLGWLLRVPAGDEWKPLAGALPVVRAMLLGSLLAAAVSWREIQEVTRRLFEGMGFAYGNIISLTITAQCFGAGIAAIGVSDALLGLLGASGVLARFLSAGIPWTLAVLSGSGSGPILTFAQTFLAHVEARHDPVTLGALACLAGAFGRTMSPVAAVVIYSSGLVGVSPLLLVRRLLPALLAGAAVSLAIVLARAA